MHMYVLWTCHGCHEVKFFEVNGAVACTLDQDDTVEVELDCGHTTVPRVVDSVASYGEEHAVRIILFGAIVYTDTSICDVLKPGEWDFIASDKHDGIGAFADSRNTLGQAAKFSGVRFAQTFLVLRVDKEVLHL